MTRAIHIDDLLYPELSYKIVGCAYDVFNELGPGHAEKTYQNGMALALKDKCLDFNEQAYHNVKFKGRLVGKRYLDFVVEEKVVVELKKNVRFSKVHIDQVLEYLVVSGLKLGILITFGRDEVLVKRLVYTKHSETESSDSLHSQ